MTNGSPSRRDGEPVYSLEYRRKLRAKQTKAEGVVWALVRNRRLGAFKFRRQFSIEHLIVDFVCLEPTSGSGTGRWLSRHDHRKRHSTRPVSGGKRLPRFSHLQRRSLSERRRSCSRDPASIEHSCHLKHDHRQRQQKPFSPSGRRWPIGWMRGHETNDNEN